MSIQAALPMIKLVFFMLLFPVICLAVYMVVMFIYRVFLMRNRDVKNYIKGIDINHAYQDTLMSILENAKNYHEIVKLNDETFLFINNYYINLVIHRSYEGSLHNAINSDKLILQKGNREELIENPSIHFDNIINKLKPIIGKRKVRQFLVVGGLCMFNLKSQQFKIIHTRNTYFFINKIELVPVYSNEEIKKMVDKLKGES